MVVIASSAPTTTIQWPIIDCKNKPHLMSQTYIVYVVERMHKFWSSEKSFEFVVEKMAQRLEET